MLIDLHAHSKAISKCSRINGIDNIELAKSIGLDGFILTNHYDKNGHNIGQSRPGFFRSKKTRWGD